MRYILYLVTLLQREATNDDRNPDEGYEGDKGESSECDDEDNDDDDDDRENNEKHISNYNQVDIEVDSNGNDAQYDINDGRDELSINSTFSLLSDL
ncbi:hypothetical protein H9Q73_011101 [Fusarium xylarioides]|nr:hypothetical protein H9Q73_011101 [Fusarium xylarioides]